MRRIRCPPPARGRIWEKPSLTEPLVSAVIIFLNEERFLRQAIESVLSQTYEHWELLLVDDGSDDRSPQIARQFARDRPGQVSFLQHPRGENRGISATRNLGIRKASGRYLAFLDGDDLWLPQKLEQQVQILESRPAAAMVYGKTEYFHDNGDGVGDPSRDRVQRHGILADRLLEPPLALTLFLSGTAAVPCICSLLVRREVVQAIAGFEDRFRDLYEDQAFYAKVCLEHPVWVSSLCLDRYRKHPASVSTTAAAHFAMAARRRYLDWLAEYTCRREAGDQDLWQAIIRERWLGTARRGSRQFNPRVRRARKWWLTLEDVVVPVKLRRRLWDGRAAGLGGPYADRPLGRS